MPAGQREQPVAQRVEAVAGARRQRDGVAALAGRRAAAAGRPCCRHAAAARRPSAAARRCALRRPRRRRSPRRVRSCRKSTASAPSISAQARAMPMRSTSSLRLVVVAQAGGVDHVQRHAFDLDRLADLVARRAGDRRDDRQLGAGQRVEQRALADVGLAGDHDLDAFAQQRALARARQHRCPAPRRRRPAARARWPAAGSRSPPRGSRASPRPACAARRAGRAARPPRSRRRRSASGWPSAPPPRCWRRSGRPRPRPAPGRACRSGRRAR